MTIVDGDGGDRSNDDDNHKNKSNDNDTLTIIEIFYNIIINIFYIFNFCFVNFLEN